MKTRPRPIVKMIGLSLVLVAVSAFLIYEASSIGKVPGVEHIEVRDYQGQKLSSINDFKVIGIEGTQYIDKANYTLAITGLVEKPKNYTYDELIGNYTHYQKIVTLNCVEGWSVTILWEGIAVRDLLNETAPLGNATTVIFHAYDGYTTSFPLSYIMDNNIIIAYKMNNVTLPPERGFPFQLVAESKWGYKWIKWITEIEISSNTNYTGYYESRGYSNAGNLNQSFIGG